MIVEKQVNPRFEDFLFDWDYKHYLLFGGYGSSKSYHIALKLILKCLEEKRKVLVIREVYETIRESCFDLFEEILSDMELLSEDGKKSSRNKVISKSSPMSFTFPNGSRIIFKGMDKPAKLKSINNVSIIWIEEASELKYAGYKELLGRLRHPQLSLHIILSWNPTDEQNWTYKHFFIDDDAEPDHRVKMNPKKVYKYKTIVKDNIYYHHSVPDDNLFLPHSYIEQLDELKDYDPDLWRVARKGEYGPNGTKVLPQYTEMTEAEVNRAVGAIPDDYHFIGLDFGYEVSYNALIRCAVDDEYKILYVYDEVYMNHVTDPEFSKYIWQYHDQLITADSAEPKTIQYYRLSGFRMRGCKKFQGSRLSNTRKIKRFRKIVVSDKCKNCQRELKNLTYKINEKGEMLYDEFNIDPHTFSAIWYALDLYEVPNLKPKPRHSKKGAA